MHRRTLLTQAADATAREATTTLRWRVVHQPSNYFIRMALRFERDVEAQTHGRVMVDILDAQGLPINPAEPTEPVLHKEARQHKREKLAAALAGEPYPADKDTLVGLERARSYRMMLDGDVDMSQIYTYQLAQVANPAYHALELPFLFDDYDHVGRVLESEVGEGLLASTVDSTGARGLAFTFSGGLLVMTANSGASLTTADQWPPGRRVASRARPATWAC